MNFDLPTIYVVSEGFPSVNVPHEDPEAGCGVSWGTKITDRAHAWHPHESVYATLDAATNLITLQWRRRDGRRGKVIAKFHWQRLNWKQILENLTVPHIIRYIFLIPPDYNRLTA